MSLQSPLVSVIIPNYNHARFLINRIESVLNQSFQDFEVIILDDCSVDKSFDIINSYMGHPKIAEIIRNNKNSGSTFKQWNKGINYARGKYIWFAESDDVCELNFLERLISIIELNNKIDLIYCQSKIIDEDGLLNQFEGCNSSPNKKINDLFNSDFCLCGIEFIEKYLISGSLIPNASSVVIRKSRMVEIGGANEDMRLFGDWLTWIRLLSYNSYIYYVNEQLSSFRCHKATVRNTVYKNSSTFYEYIKLHNELLTIFPDRKHEFFDKLVYQFLKYKSIHCFTQHELADIKKILDKYNKNSWLYILKSKIKRSLWG